MTKPLSKKELVKSLCEDNRELFGSETNANKAFDAVVNCLEKQLVAGNDISLIGFGKFSVKNRPARTGRNPQTGNEMQIPASNVVSFKAGQKLKDGMNK